MPVIRPADLPVLTGSSYPSPYREMVAGRGYIRLGAEGGLTQFGANIVVLAPGAMSSCCHAHATEDEFVMILSGECVLSDGTTETLLRPGDCAAFPAGGGEFHHFLNRTAEEARFLVVGSKHEDEVVRYNGDVDLVFRCEGGARRYTRRDGTPYGEE